MLIAVGSFKGSPGVTSFALALAVRWPAVGPAPVMVEVDPSGGDISTRRQTHDEPGLAAMAMAAQAGPLSDVSAWAHRLGIAADVVVAPPGAAAAVTVNELCARAPHALAQLAQRRPVLADLGRLDATHPGLSLLDNAYELLVMAHLTAEGVRHVRTRIAQVAARCRVRLVLTGRAGLPPEEVAGYLGVPVAATVEADQASLDLLAGRAKRSMGWTKRPLLTAARTVALGYPLATARPDLRQPIGLPGIVEVIPNGFVK
ncbi:MAG TPA: hypothetical protein VFC19_29550 [Candidatus Limnocylindrales bacterium]|nr:hypothetical protein [Candidatus Limnocylindrales bacterium]